MLNNSSKHSQYDSKKYRTLFISLSQPIVVIPISFFVISKNGAKMYSVQSEESMTEKLIDLAPKVVDKVKEFVESREGDDSGDKG